MLKRGIQKLNKKRRYKREKEEKTTAWHIFVKKRVLSFQILDVGRIFKDF